MRLFTALFLLSCSGESTDSGEVATDDSADGSGDQILPLEGSYTTGTSVTSNDCGDQAALPPQVSVSVSSATAEGYDLLLELVDQNIVFSCTLEEAAFSCSAESSEDYADWGWAVILNHTHDMQGSWLTESSFEGSLSSSTECVGSECDGFGEVIGSTLPCTVVHELDGGQ